MSPQSKKRKAQQDSEAASNSNNSNSVNNHSNNKKASYHNDRKKASISDRSPNSEDANGFRPLSLEEIQGKIQQLGSRVPKIPPTRFAKLTTTSSTDDKNNNNNTNMDDGGGGTAGVVTDEILDEKQIRDWATQLQAVLEEFNLLVCCVATATYKWGTDRSGAADQNLSLLSGELSSSQEQIASTVTPRLTNVLAPVVDLVIEKVVTTKTVTTKKKTKATNGKSDDDNNNNEEEEIETKENHFTRKLVDPDFVRLCHKILARNAPLLRHVVLANFNKLLRCLDDYLQAQKNDSQHDRGFAY